MIAGHFEVTRIVNDLRSLRADEAVAIDTETTGVKLYTGDEIRGVSLAYRGMTWYVPISHPNSANVTAHDAGRLGLALRETAALPVFHNGPGFDWKSLASIGYTPPERYWDTQIVSWLLDENTTHTLKGLAAMLWGDDEKAEQNALKELFKGRRSADIYKELRDDGWPVQAAKAEAKDQAMASRLDWASITAEHIAEYAKMDASQTLRLYHWQVERLATDFPTNPSEDVQREFDFAAFMYRIVERGVTVDEATVRGNRHANLERLAEIEAIGYWDGVNLNSPKQLAKLIFETWGLPVGQRTPTGNPSTSREALEELEGAHEALDLLIEWRRLAKSVSTYYDAIIANTDETGRIHAGYCTTCAKTGRLSSRGPNMMNLPRDDKDESGNPLNPAMAAVKKVFVPSAGMELWEYDLKSAELFVGASIAQDDDMLAALEEPGRDFHTETAVAVFGNAEGNHRTLAKNMNYGIPYGIGPDKFANYVVRGTGHGVRRCRWHAEKQRPPRWFDDCDVCFSAKGINRHRVAWPKTHLAIDRLTAFARRNGYIPLHKPGRFRCFRSPGIIVPYYTAFNAIVQGGVAEVMKDVGMWSEARLDELGAVFVLQVHDSWWVEQPVGVEAEVEAILQEMTDLANPFRARLTWDRKRLQAA